MTDIATLAQQIDQVEARFNRERQALARPDGAPVFAPAEMDQRQSQVWGTVRQELNRIGADLEAIGQEAQATIAGVDSADLTAGFSTDVLQRIATRQPFLLEDIRRLSPDARVARLRAVAEGGDRETRFLHLRIARMVKDDAIAAAGGPVLRNGRPVVVALALDGVIAALESTLLDTGKRAAAQQQIDQAGRVAAKLAGVRYMLATYGQRGRGAVTIGRR